MELTLTLQRKGGICRVDVEVTQDERDGTFLMMPGESGHLMPKQLPKELGKEL